MGGGRGGGRGGRGRWWAEWGGGGVVGWEGWGGGGGGGVGSRKQEVDGCVVEDVFSNAHEVHDLGDAEEGRDD